jgi:hypothetical protein
MSQWDEKIRNHQIWQDLSRGEGALAEAFTLNIPATTEGLERIQAVLAFLRGRLTTLDPVMTPFNSLGALSKTLRNGLLQELETFKNTKNVSNIETSQAAIDTLLSQLSSLYSPSTPDDLDGLASAATTYRNKLDQLTKEANAAAQELKAETDNTRNAAMTERQQLSNITTEYQAQFSTAQETRNRDFVNT